MGQQRPARCARTLFAGALAMVQALMFHLAAGGELRSWPALGAAVLVGLGTARLLTRRSRHPLVWVGALAAGQVVVHALFTVATRVGPGSGGHQHGLWDALHGHSCVLYGGGIGVVVLDGRYMLLAHLLAMVLSGLVLARQDALLDVLASLLRVVLARLLRPVRLPLRLAGPAHAPVPGGPWTAVALRLGAVRSLRGPPAPAPC